MKGDRTMAVRLNNTTVLGDSRPAASTTVVSQSTSGLLALEAGDVIDVLVILFLGYIAYHAFRIWIDSRIAEESADMPEQELGDEGGGAAASRLGTLLPLFRNLVLIVVVVSIALIVLMELGINVGPLFAGAGIVGDSDPLAEFGETELKMRVMLEALAAAAAGP